MKLKVVKPVKGGSGNAAPRNRAPRAPLQSGRAQDLGDRRLQLLLGATLVNR
jgi:hypothetical protein